MKFDTANSLAGKPKGKGPVSAEYAKGGEVLTSKSRFFKTQDVFRTGIERTNYGKKKTGKSSELADREGETKVEKTVKPRT